MRLGDFVAENVSRNGMLVGLSGYREMLARDFEEIPDLSFKIELLVCDEKFVASRLAFNCSPKARFLGLDVNGKKVTFAENVLYEFREDKIVQVWPIMDKPAIEAQL